MPVTVEKRTVFKMPVRAYDITTGELVSMDRYLHGQQMEADLWQNQMLKAQRTGKRINYSNEWSGAQRYLGQRHPDQELRLVDTVAWTGTLLDYTDETLKEGITLNEDGTIASAKTTLGKKEKVVLPTSSAYVKDLNDTHMPLISYLQGVKNPKRELPDYAYVWVTPSGIRPVVRGVWPWHGRDGGRVAVYAGCAPAGGRFAAWLVDEKLPENAVTLAEYEALERSLIDKETELKARMEKELKPLQERFSTAALLVE